jgi:hypothetical protein
MRRTRRPPPLWGRYQIAVREFEDGRVYDVRRLTRAGPNAWRPSYLGSATSLAQAQELALVNYQRLRTATNWEQPVNEVERRLAAVVGIRSQLDTEGVSLTAAQGCKFLAQLLSLLEAFGDVAEDGGNAEHLSFSVEKWENRKLDRDE